MNAEDKLRFARYLPGYIEKEIIEKESTQGNESNEGNKGNQGNEANEKKILGYIEKINIDKNKLIIDTIINNK
jgi:hypothetical protein